MRGSKGTRVTTAVLGVVALLATSCGGGGSSATDTPGDGETEATEASDDAGADAAGAEIATDIGITEEPCPDAVNEDHGCIYLGVLSDLTVGPFAPLGQTVVEGVEAFWARVNESGGIADRYDVNVTEYTRDNEYNPQVQSQLYREIEPEILALASSLGTPTTEAILPDMDEDDVVGIPATWWSGWDFEEKDSGLILESGASYCVASMVGLDWSNENEGEISSLISVGYPGDYGGDAAAGAQAWAEANGVEYAGFVETAPNAAVGSQDAAITQVISSGADRVLLGVGPGEAAEIVAGAVQLGFEGRFLGSTPTWNVALMGSPAADALTAVFTHIGAWEDFFGDSEAHQAMQEVLGEGNAPTNDGFTFGWVWSYPLLAALEQAAADGDLTRAGLREAVHGLNVDYEGALPARTYGDDPDANAVRTVVLSRPDAESATGLQSMATDVTGPTGDAYELDAPCVG